MYSLLIARRDLRFVREFERIGEDRVGRLVFLGVERKPLLADVAVEVAFVAENVIIVAVCSVAEHSFVIRRLVFNYDLFALAVIRCYVLFIDHIIRNRREIDFIVVLQIAEGKPYGYGCDNYYHHRETDRQF